MAWLPLLGGLSAQQLSLAPELIWLGKGAVPEALTWLSDGTWCKHGGLAARPQDPLFCLVCPGLAAGLYLCHGSLLYSLPGSSAFPLIFPPAWALFFLSFINQIPVVFWPLVKGKP